MIYFVTLHFLTYFGISTFCTKLLWGKYDSYLSLLWQERKYGNFKPCQNCLWGFWKV